MGQLAEALVGLTGLAVSAVQAKEIRAFCNALDDYDKRAIEVHLRSQKPCLRGRFCSQKCTGHTTREQMRRYIIILYLMHYKIMLCMFYNCVVHASYV